MHSKYQDSFRKLHSLRQRTHTRTRSLHRWMFVKKIRTEHQCNSSYKESNITRSMETYTLSLSLSLIWTLGPSYRLAVPCSGWCKWLRLDTRPVCHLDLTAGCLQAPQSCQGQLQELTGRVCVTAVLLAVCLRFDWTDSNRSREEDPALGNHPDRRWGGGGGGKKRGKKGRLKVRRKDDGRSVINGVDGLLLSVLSHPTNPPTPTKKKERNKREDWK